MNLTAEDRAWLAEEVRARTVDTFQVQFNSYAQRFAIDQMTNVPWERENRCELGRAWTAGIVQVIHDHQIIAMIRDGLVALERRENPEATINTEVPDSVTERSYRIVRAGVEAMRAQIIALEDELQQTRSETMRDASEVPQPTPGFRPMDA